MKEALDCLAPWLCEHLRKFIENCNENMHTDIGVYRVKSFFTTLYINLQQNFFYSENLTMMLMTMIVQSNFLCPL